MRFSPSPFAPLTPATYHILAALRARPLHAYALCQQAANDSGYAVILSSGSMHHALAGLLRRRYITESPYLSPSGRTRYQLTPTGQSAFEQELTRLKRAILIGELAKSGQITWS